MDEHNIIAVPPNIELNPGEDVVLLVRQHWFVFRNSFLIAFFIPFLLISVSFFVDYTNLSELVVKLVGQISLYGAGIAFLVGLMMFTWKFYLWRNTYYVVSNKRLILITQHGLFSYDDRETSLNMIQDFRATVDGLQPSLYGFGDVTVQVSSQDSQLTLEKVAKPRAVQRIIVREAHLKDKKF